MFTMRLQQPFPSRLHMQVFHCFKRFETVMLKSVPFYYYLPGIVFLIYFIVVLWYLVKTGTMIFVVIKLINNTGIIYFISKNHTGKQFIQSRVV